MDTMTQFVNRNKIKIAVNWAEENKNRPDWKNANHFKVTLRHGAKRLTTYFSQGYGINGEPKIEDVLNAIADDSSWVENARSFEEWASELGYNFDSREAERIYRLCVKFADKLKNFLGDDLYKELLWETQRL